MDKKNEDFSANLELEKEKFKRALEEYREKFQKIIMFHDIQKVNEFSKISNELYKNLADGNEKVSDFNRREKLFKMKESEWPDLKELADQFKPFHELINCVHDVKVTYLTEWQ